MLAKKPSLTPSQIDETLETTTMNPIGYKNDVIGPGRIDTLTAIEAVLSYKDIAENQAIATIYPNPSADVFSIHYEGMKHVEVYSVDGWLKACPPPAPNAKSMAWKSAFIW